MATQIVDGLVRRTWKQSSLSNNDIEGVSGSWQRCVDRYLLDPAAAEAPQVLTGDELRRLSEPVENLLARSREELDQLYSLVRPAGYATVLAEPGGVIVERQCPDGDAEAFSAYGTRPGAIWGERNEGTNGIGTCIVEQRPISVHRRQHFRRRHADLSCCGAPIFGPDGCLSAVLNVASYATETADRSHGLALAMVTYWARAIEERQFRERFRRYWTIALERSDADQPAVMLAIDADQRIVGLDRGARALFALDATQLAAGVGLWAVFDGDRSALRCKAGSDVTISLTRRSGSEPWHGLLTPPDGRVSAKRASRDGTLHTRPRIGLLPGLRRSTSVPAPRGGLSPRSLRRVREYIEANLDRNVRVDELAGLAGLSVYHFSREFKQSVGVPPHAYLLRRRIEIAADLIGGTELPLSEIAVTTGFSDQSHLTRQFYRHLGSTPNAFRRALR